MDIEKLDINAVCFGILCNFTPVCGEERAKEAVELVRTLQAENEKLRAELEQVKREKDAAVECCRGYCESYAFERDCTKHDMNDAAPTRWYYGDCEDWEWRGPEEGCAWRD